MNATSVAEIAEREIVDFLFSGLQIFPLAEALGLDNWEAFFSIAQGALGLSGCPGDIDALLVPKQRYDLATAIECKRVKFQADALVSDFGRPNKIKQLRKAVRQTNGLWEMGFRRVFLIVVVQVDARLQPGGNWFGKGLRADQANLLFAMDPFRDLNPAAGVIVVEMVQPADKRIREAGGIGISYSRPPHSRSQPQSLTARIKEYFEKSPRSARGSAAMAKSSMQWPS